MRFADALTDSSPSGTGTCKVATILAALDEENRTDLTDALTQGVSSLRISNALGRMGVEVADSTIWKHRSGQCRCA